jgi:hypothetical protein
MAVGRSGRLWKERARDARIPAWAVMAVAAATPAIACRSAMKIFGAMDGRFPPRRMLAEMLAKS